MDKRKNYFLSILAVATTTSSGLAAAKPPVQFSVSVASKVTDNALKAQTQAFSERQDRVNLGLLADYQNSWSNVDANYRNSWNYYQKDSQNEKRTLTGSGHLLLGNDTAPIGINVSHSSEYTLDKATQVDLLDNQDRRQISAASPYLRLRLSPVDKLTLTGNYSDISYQTDTDKNSQRQGGSLSWSHQLSKTNGFSLSASRSDSDFEQFYGAGYSSETASVSYFSQLRQLNYRLMAGVNRYETDANDANSMPMYEMDIGYVAARHQLNLRLGQRYTDSSQGNGNDAGFNAGSVGSSSADLDIYQRNYGRMSWAFTPVLDRLTATLYAEFEQENYENLTDNNSDELGFGVDFNYSFGSRDNLMLRLESRSNEFKVTANNYETYRAALNYQHKLPANFDFNAFINYEQRRQKGPYSEQQLGMKLGYRY